MIGITDKPLAQNPTKYIGPFNDPQPIGTTIYFSVTYPNSQYLSIQADGSYEKRTQVGLFETFSDQGDKLVCSYGQDAKGDWVVVTDPAAVKVYIHVIPKVAL